MFKLMRDDTVYIFLDVDGVLNKSSKWKRMFHLDDECIACFARYAKRISPKSSPKVVLTSTWKNGFQHDGNHSSPVMELVSRLREYGIPIIGKTDSDDAGNRSKEINQYINKHGLESSRCIAVDDDKQLFQSKLASNAELFLVNAATGFTEHDVDRKRSKGTAWFCWLLGRN